MQMKIMQTDEIYHFVYTLLECSCCIVEPQIEPAPNELDHKLILFNLIPQQKKNCIIYGLQLSNYVYIIKNYR